MTQYVAEYHAGKWQVVATSNGIDHRTNSGPRWNTAAEARAHIVRMVNLEVVSPLRDSRSEPNEPVVLGGMTDGPSALNEASQPHLVGGLETPLTNQPPAQPGASPLVGTAGG